MAGLIGSLFFGLALGCTYALVALGFTMIFKASGVINFAQGELLLVGAYIVAAAVLEYQLNFFVALLVALVGTVLIGVLFERFVLRRMIGRPVFSILMITIGLDLLLLQAVQIRMKLVGNFAPAAAAPFDPGGGVNTSTLADVNNIHFGVPQIVTIVVTAVCVLALYLFFQYTRYGLAMRATALDQEAALALGINVRTVYALAWGIAAAIGTIGGVLLPFDEGGVAGNVQLTLGQIALLAFPAIILGGIDSVPGAIVGGIVIGLTQQLVQTYGNSLSPVLGVGYYAVAPYILMILVLLVRPYGLFGTRKVERV